MLEFLGNVGETIAGVVAAAAIIVFLAGRYRGTLGRRSDHYGRLARLGTSAQLSFFTSVIGQPAAIRQRREIWIRDSGRQVRKRGFDCCWVDRDYFVAALTDEDETIQALAITTRSKSFRPRFQSVRGRAYPKLEVRLGRTRFSEIEARPIKIESRLGNRRSGYNEIYYFGNPGYYQHFVCGVNDAGIRGWALSWT
jgi:hypothetical protein